MSNNFQNMNLNNDIISALEKQKIETPTEIQENIIPLIITKKDIVARSETGSGKTLAYLIPIFQKIDMSIKGVQALIITPTHELSVQVFHQAELLAENSGMDVGVMMMIGSANSSRQLEKLKKKPRIIIGSTGRILDFIYKKKLPAHLIKTIILDEGDRLLEDGNYDDVKQIIKSTLKERQIVLLSASIDKNTITRAKEIMKDDMLVVESKTGALVPQQIEHFYLLSTPRDKFLNLRKVLAIETVKKAIVFINNPENIEVTVDKLCYHNIEAVGIYGQISKEDRKKSIEDFRSGKARVLVSSDISARGLDIPDVTHVINIDVPEEPTHYLHRAGRCGRNGVSGIAVTFVTPYERKWVHKYSKVWGIIFQQKEMSFGKLINSTMTKKDLEPNKKYSGNTNNSNFTTKNDKKHYKKQNSNRNNKSNKKSN